MMNARINEIEKDIYKITIGISEHKLAPSDGFEFNHFLLKDKKSMLIHTGGKWLFETLRSAIAEIVRMEDLIYIAFSHFESDECGSLNNWLAAAPSAIPLVGGLGKATMEDFSVKAPMVVKDGQQLPLGRRNILVLETPHIPHNWDACLFFETTSGTLFSSDLGAQPGLREPVTEEDLTEVILDFQERVGFVPGGKALKQVVEKLEKLDISYLATMHGSTLKGSCITELFKALKAAR